MRSYDDSQSMVVACDEHILSVSLIDRFIRNEVPRSCSTWGIHTHLGLENYPDLKHKSVAPKAILSYAFQQI